LVQSGAIGKPMLASWVAYVSLTPDNKFYQTPWRRSGTFPGGFIMDGGVHNIAAFRRVLGEITHVNAAVTQMRADLPPADTLVAAFQFEGGFIGSFTISFAAASPFGSLFTVVGDQGALRVDWGKVEISNGGETRSEPVSGIGTMQAELTAFADVIRDGKPSHAGSPLEALRDVAVIEAILRSGEMGYRVEVDLCRDLENQV
jgi:predicted dehydrogenase